MNTLTLHQTSSFFLRFASSLAGSGMGISSGALSDARSLQLKHVWQKSQVNLTFQWNPHQNRESATAHVPHLQQSLQLFDLLREELRNQLFCLFQDTNDNSLRTIMTPLDKTIIISATQRTSLVRFRQKASTCNDQETYINSGTGTVDTHVLLNKATVAQNHLWKKIVIQNACVTKYW